MRMSMGGLLVAAVVVLPVRSVAADAAAPDVSAVDSFAIVARSLASSGASTVDGDIAARGGPSTVEHQGAVVDGGDPYDDALAAATLLGASVGSQPCDSDRTGEDQGDLRLGSDVYCYIESAGLDGTLRLDALGTAGLVWVFQVAGDYTAAPSSSVLTVNGASPCNVFWFVDGDVTLGAGTSFAGTIVATGDILMGEGASLVGRALAPGGSVALRGASISLGACGQATSAPSSTTTTTTAPTTVPGPGAPTGPGGGEGGAPTTGAPPVGSGSASLPRTGAVTGVVAALAFATLALGHSLVATGRVVRWNALRWRPRHAVRRSEALQRGIVGVAAIIAPIGRHSRRR